MRTPASVEPGCVRPPPRGAGDGAPCIVGRLCEGCSERAHVALPYRQARWLRRCSPPLPAGGGVPDDRGVMHAVQHPQGGALPVPLHRGGRWAPQTATCYPFDGWPGPESRSIFVFTAQLRCRAAWRAKGAGWLARKPPPRPAPSPNLLQGARGSLHAYRGADPLGLRPRAGSNGPPVAACRRLPAASLASQPPGAVGYHAGSLL